MSKRIAFIVGRYQNIDLHSGYIHLFKKSLEIEGVVGFVIVIGSSPVPATRRNPFNFEERKTMIIDSLKNREPNLSAKMLGLFEQLDQNEDRVWSSNLDKEIEAHLDWLSALPEYDNAEPILVCSRDSFKSHYSGKHPVIEIDPIESVSSTEAREKLAKSDTYPNESYLLGKLNAIYSKYPTVYPTVDIAIIKEETGEILLGRKHRESKWRFPGGFSDPTDESFEMAAKREAIEEVGPIELSDWKYVCSYRVNDWRYRSEIDKIITSFFRCSYVFGHPIASDDLAEVKWFKLNEIREADVFPGHWELLNRLQAFEKKEKERKHSMEQAVKRRISGQGAFD